MSDKFYLTKQGLRAIEQDFISLKKLRELKVEKSAPAPFHSEELNTEFVAFREDLDYIDTRLEEIAHVLKNYELIKLPPKSKQDQIDLGAEITVDINGKDDKFIMVGTLEADPTMGKISNESPVGRALVGHKVGDKIVLTEPIKIVYNIKKVAYK